MSSTKDATPEPPAITGTSICHVKVIIPESAITDTGTDPVKV